jgi:TatD DNase family protein
MRVFDGHTHLEEIEDISGAIARAGKSGVFSIVTVGSDYESNRRALEISGEYERTAVHAALGIHPWNLKADQLGRTFRFIEENMQKAVAMGEIGLDFWIKRARKDPSERELQKEVFERLLDLGKKYKKPAIIHCRGAWEECLNLVIKAQVPKAIFHWPHGDFGESAGSWLFYLSHASGSIQRETSEGYRQSATGESPPGDRFTGCV